MPQQNFIDVIKDAIVKNDLESIKEYLTDAKDMNFDWPTVFQKVYLHACLKKRKDIAVWLQDTVFPTMDPIQQIALRQVFSYGRHLLAD